MAPDADSPSPSPRWRSWVVSLLGFVLLQGSLHLLGPWRASFFPVLYVWVHLVAGLAGPGPSLTVLALGMGVEGLRAGWGLESWVDVVVRWGLFMLFASTAAGVLRVEVLRLRRQQREQLTARQRRFDQEARDYRLVSSLLGPQSPPARSAEERERVRKEGSVQALRRSTHTLLELLRSAIEADAVRLFLQGDDGKVEQKAEAPAEANEPFGRRAPTGALAAVLKTDRPIHLNAGRGAAGFGYETRAQAFVGIPIRFERWVVGVLAAERRAPRPFGETDELLLTRGAEHLAQSVEVERLLSTMDRLKGEQERFLDAFTLLADARTVDEAASRLVDAVRATVEGAELRAFFLYERESDAFRTSALEAPEDLASVLRDLVLPHDGSHLISSAVRVGQTLPVAEFREETVVFGSAAVPGLKSVKVFPVLHRDQPLGVLVVGSRRKGRELGRDGVRWVEAVVAQSAMSLGNAQLFEEVQLRATTDGLTGLVNHRRFQELLDEALARADRFERPVSVLMIDADHFKSINDTFGHPVGDVVLRRIAALLQEEGRQTDVVARYGGEEFVMILEGTDREGGCALAERIRERVEAERIVGDFGKLSVTVSLGLAVRDAGRAQAPGKAALLDQADKALYRAKQRGRNRVEVAPALRSGSAIG